MDLVRYEYQFNQEIEILRKIEKHPNIVGFFGYLTNEFYGYIFLELLQQKNLEDHVQEFGRMAAREALVVGAQILKALKHLQRKDISHHDLKPENISYNPAYKHVKIFDFGLAIEARTGQKVQHPFGTPLYQAPEVLASLPHCPYRSDIWSFGITLYFLFHKYTPFESATTIEELIERVENEEIKYRSSISQKIKKRLRKLLKKRAEDRTNIKKASQAIRKILKSSRKKNFDD